MHQPLTCGECNIKMSMPSVAAEELQAFKAAFFKALAHPVRIQILELLVNGEKGVQELQDALVGDLQKVRIDEDDVPDEIGSLAQSAEALRLTAAAPPRNQNIGGDYDG